MNGGALFFCEDSTMYLKTNTTIQFFDINALHSGGAIYAQHQCLTNQNKWLEKENVQQDPSETIHLHFQNNTAKYAGSVLYGGTVDEIFCPFDKLLHTYEQCAELTYTIFSDGGFEQLMLLAVKPQLAIDTNQVTITQPYISD